MKTFKNVKASISLAQQLKHWEHSAVRILTRFKPKLSLSPARYSLHLGGGAGKVPDPPGALPRRQELASDFTVPGARRVKIRSGPYRVPNMGVKSLSGHYGMLEGYLERDAKKPCSNGECSLLRLVGGLEYANGSVANINTGMW